MGVHLSAVRAKRDNDGPLGILGGNLTDASIQQIWAGMVRIGLQRGEKDHQVQSRSETSSGTVGMGEGASHYGVRHGPGLVLSNGTTQGIRELTSASLRKAS